jgi:hypothetical protein
MTIRMGTIFGSTFIKAAGFSGTAGNTATLRIQFDDATIDFSKVPFTILNAWLAARTPCISICEIFTALFRTKRFNAMGERSHQRRFMDIHENKRGDTESKPEAGARDPKAKGAQ